MENYKLTVEDLITEYMISKVRGGYDPRFTGKEFLKFLSFFESKMKVEVSTYDTEDLFNRYYNLKMENDWFYKDWKTEEIVEKPSMKLGHDGKDVYLEATYNLSNRDKNTEMERAGITNDVKNIIADYLFDKRKRNLKESIAPDVDDWLIACSAAATIIDEIWQKSIKKYIDHNQWPIQCTDINKYLFETDLASIIGLESKKEQLCNLFDVLSKRIAILYHQDKNLQINSTDNPYLAYSNYKLLIEGQEDLINKVYGKYQKQMKLDFTKQVYEETHEADGVYDYDEDPDIVRNESPIETEKTKKLVHNIYNRKK